MPNSLLTVVTFNYNYAKYLPETLQGIAAQNDIDFEYIIIDDASTDSSVSLLKKFSNKHSYARLITYKENQGLFALYKKSLLMAKGKYIYWACSDDYILPEFLSKTTDLLENNPKLNLCCCNPTLFNEHGYIKKFETKLPKKPSVLTSSQVLDLLLHSDFWLAGNATVYKRSYLIQKNYPYEDLGKFTDWYLNYSEAFLNGIGYIPENLAYYRTHDVSYSNSLSNPSKEKQLYQSLLKRLSKEPKGVQDSFFEGKKLHELRAPIIAALLKYPKYWKLIPNLMISKGPRYIKNRIFQICSKLLHILRKRKSSSQAL